MGCGLAGASRPSNLSWVSMGILATAEKNVEVEGRSGARDVWLVRNRTQIPHLDRGYHGAPGAPMTIIVVRARLRDDAAPDTAQDRADAASGGGGRDLAAARRRRRDPGRLRGQRLHVRSRAGPAGARQGATGGRFEPGTEVGAPGVPGDDRRPRPQEVVRAAVPR